ncbi:MAG TPA: ATP-binding protein, partial [Acidobacteriaceae bacterium]|nr:ATP-binding protein [Acidobacteriaceae bacterium]
DIETVEGLLYFTPDGKLEFRDDYHNHAESKHIQERYLEVLSPDGQVLFRNDRLGDATLGGPVFANEGVGGYSGRTERLADGTRVALVSRRHTMAGRPILIRLAYSMEPIWGQIYQLLLAFLAALPIALAGAGFAGYSLARRALDPLSQMTRRAEQITPDRLHERLPVENPHDELGQMGRVFNDTLDRLENAFDQMRRFTADASHELRTPLTAIRSVGEVGLQRDATREEYREIIGSMLEEANRLTRLVENLLAVSRADAGQVHLQRRPIPVLDLTRESAALLDVLIDEKDQKLQLDGDATATVIGDRLILRQAVVNILHNAIKFSPVHGAISVSTTQDDREVRIRIADSGPGIAEEHRDKVFQRFYRVDSSRSSDTGGTGLGLSIAQWAVQAHGGRITIDNLSGAGCAFQIAIPSGCLG